MSHTSLTASPTVKSAVTTHSPPQASDLVAERDAAATALEAQLAAANERADAAEDALEETRLEVAELKRVNDVQVTHLSLVAELHCRCERTPKAPPLVTHSENIKRWWLKVHNRDNGAKLAKRQVESAFVQSPPRAVTCAHAQFRAPLCAPGRTSPSSAQPLLLSRQ